MMGMIAALPALASVANAEESMITSFLMKLGQLRTSFTPTTSVEGRTWGELSFMEKVKVYDWNLELWVVGTFAVFIVFYLIGRSINEKKVYRFYNSVKPVLDENFGFVGTSPSTPIIKDSDTRYTTYASGRVNIESMIARFRMIDRQNILNYTIGLVMPSLASADGRPDHIEVTIKPMDPRAIEPGIFAIANKESLPEAQTENFFFELAKPVDSDKLPSPTYIFLTEHSDQIDMLYTPELKRVLALPGAEKVFKWISYSDVPTTEPKKEEDVSGYKYVTVNFNYPSSAEECEACSQILNAALEFVDVLVAKPAYRGTTMKRIKATREAEAAKIRKAEEQTKKEELEAKKAEERRDAARKERNMSEKEQRKLQKKESDKQSRKQRQKMTRKS